MPPITTFSKVCISVDGHLDGSCILVIVTSDTINLGVQVSLQHNQFMSFRNISLVGLLSYTVVLV